jgi:hypothetical protein
MVQQTLFLMCAISYQPGALAKHHVVSFQINGHDENVDAYLGHSNGLMGRRHS